MAVKKFGYVRVSTREQNLDRQIHILRDEEGIDECDIYVEKDFHPEGEEVPPQLNQ